MEDGGGLRSEEGKLYTQDLLHHNIYRVKYSTRSKGFVN
jgi:hypothetical protein